LLPVSSGKLRLLHLLPRYPSFGGDSGSSMPSTDSHPLACILAIKPLDPPPQYTALSYTWGCTRLTRQLLVNGILIRITESLDIALRHLQREREVLTLWVDAVCINQNDNDEKSQQVTQMTEIYRSSTRVLVWLGPERDESDKVIDYVELIGREYHDHGLSGIGVGRLLQMMQNQEDDEYKAVTSSLGSLIQKFEHLFLDEFPIIQYRSFIERGWWCRAWVIQELCVPKEAIFMCGRKTVSFDHLFDTTSFLHCISVFRLRRMGVNAVRENLPSEETLRALENNQLLHKPSTASIMLSYRSNYQLQGPKDYRTLYSLLRGHLMPDGPMKIKATDARDRVFALLGLASDKATLKILVDYKKPTNEVYTDTSRALLTNGRLEILSIRHNNHLRSTLPSWACDWSAEPYLPYGDPTNIDRPFAASGSSNPQVKFSDIGDPHVASIQGLDVGDIREAGSPPWDKVSDVGEDLELRFKAAAIFMSDVEHLCRNGPTEDMATILLAELESYNDDNNPLPQKRRATTKSQEGYKAMKSWLRVSGLHQGLARLQAQQQGNFITDEMSQIVAELSEIQRDTDHAAVRSFWDTLSISLERRPFRSAQGHVGMGPPDTQPGDKICIFFGSRFPHVIRPGEAGRYRLVGEAYVHGIMDGEIMEEGNLKASQKAFELY
jgi:hypothetical protein